MNPRFAESWINKRHTVLGFELRPFCLWYRLLFEVTDSPFLSGGPVGLPDLYAAVRMCRLEFDEWLREGWFDRAERANIKRLAREFDTDTEAAKMTAYLGDYFSPPEFWQKSSVSGSDAGLPPETASVAAQIIAATGWEEERAWMLPLGKAYWYSALFARIGGADIRFVSETDEDLSVLAKLKAEYQAEKARRKGVELKPKA